MKADIGDLDPLGELGHGTCGYVIKMRHRASNTLMAVKVGNFGMVLLAGHADVV